MWLMCNERKESCESHVHWKYVFMCDVYHGFAKPRPRTKAYNYRDFAQVGSYHIMCKFSTVFFFFFPWLKTGLLTVISEVNLNHYISNEKWRNYIKTHEQVLKFLQGQVEIKQDLWTKELKNNNNNNKLLTAWQGSTISCTGIYWELKCVRSEIFGNTSKLFFFFS